MSVILSIETATDVCSVCVSRDGKILSIREIHKGKSHAEVLTSFISECAEEAKIDLQEIDAVAVSKGPGSFTGLRIGVATAKGLCYALDKPLIAVNTLHGMAAMRSLKALSDSVIMVPMIDARRMEVYTAAYDLDLREISEVEAVILTQDSFSTILAENQKLVLFGDGSIKAKALFESNKQIEFDDEALPSAEGIARIASQLYENQLFEDLAYFEPYYLKDFMGPKAKKGS